MDRFIAAKGIEVVHALTNFSASEINTLWTNIKTFVTKNWNVGSGRKCPVTGKDMLFMTLVTLKHAGTWDILSASFDESAATFSSRIHNFVRVLHPYLVRNTSDIEMFKANLGFHSAQLEKQPNDTNVSDTETLRDKFPNQWAVLADKGYQGIQEYIRGFTPVKRPPHGHMTMEQERANAKLSSDRVIVENFFGRLKTLWGLVSDKYTWKRDEYNMYFQTCVAFTNIHVRFNPLRNVDGEGYNQYKNRLLSIESKIKSKNASSKAKYRENRRAQIQAVLRRASTGYTSDDYDVGYEEGDDIFD
ncbi:hypothetical protein DYB25_003297 [Aphanomyces astaci]|uniref:DDE Tnp4 domain-containing protein n=1 Tax=Aphanomyces astaci TaxID=112090 RepID=A0A397AYQ8_APHAT|nr:hypothetical protein DYB25_003297 [Aphanomyces astaci]